MSTTDLASAIGSYLDKSTGPVDRETVNVNDAERLVSSALGSVMVYSGLKRGSIGGLLVAGLGGGLIYRSYTGHCGIYKALGRTSARAASPGQYQTRGINVQEAITISKPADQLYAFWRKFENLPSFMNHLQSVTPLDDKSSRWVAKGPAGTNVSWDAEIINDQPNETIAWRSLPGARVDNSGSVRFLPAPDGQSTEVRVNLDYIPPGGVAGKWFAKLFGEAPDQSIHEDLRRFKMLMEAGEIATTDGQSHG